MLVHKRDKEIFPGARSASTDEQAHDHIHPPVVVLRMVAVAASPLL